MGAAAHSKIISKPNHSLTINTIQYDPRIKPFVSFLKFIV